MPSLCNPFWSIQGTAVVYTPLGGEGGHHSHLSGSSRRRVLAIAVRLCSCLMRITPTHSFTCPSPGAPSPGAPGVPHSCTCPSPGAPEVPRFLVPSVPCNQHPLKPLPSWCPQVLAPSLPCTQHPLKPLPSQCPQVLAPSLPCTQHLSSSRRSHPWPYELPRGADRVRKGLYYMLRFAIPCDPPDKLKHAPPVWALPATLATNWRGGSRFRAAHSWAR